MGQVIPSIQTAPRRPFGPDGSQSLSLPPLGPLAFNHCILQVPVSQQYRVPTNITKYSGVDTGGLSTSVPCGWSGSR
jgi:hypothetical protein